MMEQAEFERIREGLDQKLRERFPDAPIERIEILKYGDEPAIEPGQFLARVIVATPRVGDGEEARALEAFHDANKERFHELRRELDKLPFSLVVQFTSEEAPEGRPEGGPEGRKKRVLSLGGRPVGTDGPGMVPVMARVGPEDLETLDTLISAGIASSRAEAVRWALARIRERPAYEQLRARTREIDDLKSQF
jgi:hypothetical protein